MREPTRLAEDGRMSLRCAWCSRSLGYVHGHAACLFNRCPMFGVNQAECCTGEVCVPATSSVGRAPSPEHPESDRKVS